MFSWKSIRFFLFGLLFSGSVFLSSYSFVNPEITAKLYFAEIASLIVCVFMFLTAIRERFGLGATRTDWLVMICLLYICLRTLLLGAFGLSLVMPFFCFSLLYYCWHYFPPDALNVQRISRILGFIALAEAFYGLLPMLLLIRGVPELPVIKGSFDNPAGFAACLVCLFPWCFYNVFSTTKGKKVLWIVTVALVVAGVIASGSRVGMLCIVLVSLCSLFRKMPGMKWWTVRRRIVVGAFSLIVLLIALYLFRVDSANGRLLIWRCSAGLIKDHPLVGTGPHGFQANYMLYQAAYFKANPDSGFSMLADNVQHPFNEYVAFVCEYGIIGLLLLGLLCGSAYKAYRNGSGEDKYTALLCLMSVLVFSCFSYPFRYSIVWILVAYSLSILVQGEKLLWVVSGWKNFSLMAALVMLSLFFLFFSIRRMKVEERWNTVAHLSLMGQTEKMLPEYEQLYKVLGDDPHFVYNYGAELFQVARYEQSLSLVRQCSQGLNDVDVQMLLAMNYAALNRVDSAQHSYILASQMCPNRFAPLIGLMRLYAASNRMDEAKEMARTVLSKEIKVPSDRVLMMIDEAKRFVELRDGL